MKKEITATIASFVVMFALGGVWHMMLMENWYNEHTALMPEQLGFVKRSEPLMLYVAGGTFALAFLMSYVYPRFNSSDKTKMMRGLRFGMVMGLIAFLPLQCILYGVTFLFSRSVLLVDTIWNMVNTGIGGIIIAMVYGDAAKNQS